MINKITKEGFDELKMLHVELSHFMNRFNLERIIGKRFSNYYMRVPQQSRYSGNDPKRKRAMKASGQ